MNQIICSRLKEKIREHIKYDGRCSFQFEYKGSRFCHFLADSDCGYYGERLDLPFEERQEFYRCHLV